MQIRTATPDDAPAILAIYAPVVTETAISFETETPSLDEMRRRIAHTLANLPWLVGLDPQGAVCGYVYASKFRERAAYQWTVEVTAYVRADSRGQRVGQRLYGRLFELLAGLGYCQAAARHLRCPMQPASPCTRAWALSPWPASNVWATSWAPGAMSAIGRRPWALSRRCQSHHAPLTGWR